MKNTNIPNLTREMAEKMTTSELKNIANEAAIASNKAYKAKDFESFEYFHDVMHIAIVEYQAR